MARRYEGKVIGALSSQVVNASTAATFSTPAAGFHSNGDGVAAVQLERDTAPVSFNVGSGMTYEYRITGVSDTSTVQIIALFNE